MKYGRISKVVILYAWIFIVCEGGARLIFSSPNFYNRPPLEYNGYWREYWLMRHNSSVRTNYTFDDYNPKRGWSLRPGLRNEIVFKDKILNSNSKGIREQVEYDYDKPPGKIRILIFGDSFTFGDEVSDNETYSFYLRQLLPGVEVINFGVHGYGHDQMLIYLKEEGVRYNPDIVILGFVVWDMPRNILEFRDYAKPSFVMLHNRLELRNPSVPPPEITLKREIYRLKFPDLLTIIYDMIEKRLGLRQARIERITGSIFDEMVGVILDIKAKPLFVYLSVGDEIKNNQKELTASEEHLYKYCSSRGIGCIFTRPYFSKARKASSILETFGHWNKEEHLLAADAIKQYLLDNKLLPLKR